MQNFETLKAAWRAAANYRWAFAAIASIPLAGAASVEVAAAEQACKERLRAAIDIGHTPKRAGATSASGKKEYEFNKRFVFELERAARKRRCVRVSIVNRAGSEISLNARTDVSVALAADVFLSIHHDSSNKKYWQSWTHNGKQQFFSDAFRGYSLFVSSENEHKQFDPSLALATAIAKRFKQARLVHTLHHADPIKGENRKVLRWDLGIYDVPFRVIRRSKTPSVLVELGVLINRDEEKQLEDPAYRLIMANAILDALEDVERTRNDKHSKNKT